MVPAWRHRCWRKKKWGQRTWLLRSQEPSTGSRTALGAGNGWRGLMWASGSVHTGARATNSHVRLTHACSYAVCSGSLLNSVDLHEANTFWLLWQWKWSSFQGKAWESLDAQSSSRCPQGSIPDAREKMWTRRLCQRLPQFEMLTSFWPKLNNLKLDTRSFREFRS